MDERSDEIEIGDSKERQRIAAIEALRKISRAVLKEERPMDFDEIVRMVVERFELIEQDISVTQIFNAWCDQVHRDKAQAAAATPIVDSTPAPNPTSKP